MTIQRHNPAYRFTHNLCSNEVRLLELKGTFFRIKANVCSIQGVDIILKLFFGKDLGKKVHTMLELDDEFIEHRLLRE